MFEFICVVALTWKVTLITAVMVELCKVAVHIYSPASDKRMLGSGSTGWLA